MKLIYIDVLILNDTRISDVDKSPIIVYDTETGDKERYHKVDCIGPTQVIYNPTPLVLPDDDVPRVYVATMDVENAQ